MAVPVSTGRQDGRATVMVVADLKIAPAQTKAVSQEITTTGTRAVSAGLSQAPFIDSSSIAILLKGRHEADRTGVEYRVTDATGMARQVLRLTGVLEYSGVGPWPMHRDHPRSGPTWRDCSQPPRKPVL